MTSREAFEAHMRERFGAHANLARSPDGYVSTVLHAVLPSTYASVQMLWEGWQAAIQHARDVAVKVCEELEEHYSDYKDTALLNGDIALSNAASGEPRAARAIADAIKEALK